MSAGRPEISVVLAVHNEAGGIERLVEEIDSTMSGRAFEVVFVDDGSTDDTRARLHGLKGRFPHLRVLGHRTCAGLSRALRTGVAAARANVVVTLDGGGQSDPADIVAMANQLVRPDAPPKLALVQGQPDTRSDGAFQRLGAGLNGLIRGVFLKGGHPGGACASRAFLRDAFLQLPYFDHMHSYLPALMASEGYAVETRKVTQRKRAAARRKQAYDAGGPMTSLSDLRGVMWLRKRRRSPGGIDEI